MEINMNNSLSLARTGSNDTLGITVLKKSIDSEAQGAMALIAAIPQPAPANASNLPPHLGQNINTTA